MLILSIKTNEPTSEVGLFGLGNAPVQTAWQGHRQLSVTIHKKIEELLNTHNKELRDIEGIAFFAGPGSFTGLRIGAAVAGSLAYGLQVPIVSAKGKDWQKQAAEKLENGEDEKKVRLFYGKEPRITTPKK
jgi:tRNA threonylcarbamoyladenosine biosynthesis protein TsaB